MQVIDGLRALGEEGLAAALRARPDLLATAPTHLGELANRAASPPAVRAGVDHCDSWMLTVLHLLAIASDGTPLADVAGLVRTEDGVAPTVTDMERAVDALAQLLLVFRTGETWRVNPGVATVLPRPGGLGRPARVLLGRQQPADLLELGTGLGLTIRRRRTSEIVEELCAAYGDPEVVDAALERLSPRARRLLAESAVHGALTTGGWGPERHRGGRTPGDEVVLAGLAVPVAWGRAEIPLEVGLAVRGGVVVDGVVVDAPPMTTEAVEPATVDADAAGRAAATSQDLARVLAALADAPAPPLKAGGLGAREVKRLAKATGLAVDEVALLLELALVAGLVPPAGGAPVAPTEGAARWLALSPGERWVELAEAWVRSSRGLSAALRDDLAGRTRPALAFESGAGDDWWSARAAALGPLAELDEGRRPTRSVVDAVAWRHPLGWGRLDHAPDEVVGWALDEAAAVGFTGLGALGAVGRRLLADDRAGALDAAATLLPAPPAEVVLQADLTAVVDAAAPHELLVELRLLADPESTGPVEVLRFSPTSVRRAFDAGRTSEEVLTFLAHHAARGVPQPLDYLVRDTARRWGHVRVGPAAAYLRCDDEALLAEVVAHRGAARHGLRLLAPTVAVATVPARQVLDWLRAVGHLPAAEGDDGLLLAATPPTTSGESALDTVRLLGERRRPLPVVGPAPAAEAARLRMEASRLLGSPVSGHVSGRDPMGRFLDGRPELAAARLGAGATPDLDAELADLLAAAADFDGDDDEPIDLDEDDVEGVLRECKLHRTPVEIVFLDDRRGQVAVVGRVAEVGADVVLVLAEPGDRPVLVGLAGLIALTTLGPPR
ncbi:MAG: helicase-associated domain-containing protein [Acidimicrobiales bacterium]